ncbi:MAG: PH domain-containing protein [Acetobacteraceae bacterium]
MTYYERVLQPGEVVLALGRLHWIILVPPALLLVASLALMTFDAWLADPGVRPGLHLGASILGSLGLCGLVVAAIRRWVTEIVVTNRRVIHKRGLVVRYTMEMNITQIEAVLLDQGILARLLDYGTVLIHGSGGGLEPLRPVGAPLVIRRAIPAQ